MDALIYSVIFLPLLAGLLIYSPLIPEDEKIIRHISKFSDTVVILMILVLGILFDISSVDNYIETGFRWINILGINPSFLVDTISYLHIILSGFVFLIIIHTSKSIIKDNHRIYYALILCMQTFSTGLILTKDIFAFLTFMLGLIIPAYIIISMWCYIHKDRTSTGFLVYKSIAGTFILLGFLLLYFLNFKYTGSLSSDINDIDLSNFSDYTKTVISYLLMAGFLLNMPVVPFHRWYIDSVTKTPNSVSILISVILFIVSAYGFFNYAIHLLQPVNYTTVLILIGTLNIVFAAFAIYFEKNLKQIIAYTGVMISGIFINGVSSVTTEGMTGGISLVISYSLTSIGIYIINEIIYRNYGTYNTDKIRGLGIKAKRLLIISVILVSAYAGLPLLPEANSVFLAFTSSMMVISSNIFNIKILTLISIVAFITVSARLISVYSHIYTGKPLTDKIKISDIKPKQALILLTICILIILTGVFPNLITGIISGYCNNIFNLMGAF